MEEMSLTVSLSILVILGIVTQWLSTATRIPSILLLLVVGVLAGPVLGFINPEHTLGDLLVPITSLSVAIILFEGGVTLRFRDIEEVGHVIRNTVSIGAIAAYVAIYFFLYYALQFSFTFSLLESAVLLISGPTVITPILKELHIKQPVRSILKWEGIVIDPIGAIIAVVIFEGLLSQHAALEVMVINLLKAVIIGFFFGWAGASFLLHALRRFWIPDLLHSPVTLMILFLIFTSSNLLQADSGLLSVTLMGIILANQSKTAVAHIIDFKENLSIILISFLFITLAAIIDLNTIQETWLISSALVLFIIFIARPLQVLLSGAFSALPKNQAYFMCCLAPKGIVTAIIASLFGLQLGRIGFSEADYFAPITFTVIVGTVTFYSLFAPFAARFLNVASAKENGVLIIGANTLARKIGKALFDAGFKVELIDSNYWKVAETKQAPLPVFKGTFLAYETKHPDKLEEISTVLAMTENDDVNSLAVIHFRSLFDESELYQLPAKSLKIKESLMGQQLFKFDYLTLSKLLEDGYQIKQTKLTSTFTYKDWKEKYSEKGAILLFYIQPGGELIPQTKELEFLPGSRGKIIFLTHS